VNAARVQARTSFKLPVVARRGRTTSASVVSRPAVNGLPAEPPPQRRSRARPSRSRGRPNDPFPASAGIAAARGSARVRRMADRGRTQPRSMDDVLPGGTVGGEAAARRAAARRKPVAINRRVHELLPSRFGRSVRKARARRPQTSRRDQPPPHVGYRGAPIGPGNRTKTRTNGPGSAPCVESRLRRDGASSRPSVSSSWLSERKKRDADCRRHP